METKICTKCHKEKDLNEFLILKKRNGRESQCRSCRTARVLDWRNRNINRHRKHDREYKRTLLWKKPLETRIHNIKGLIAHRAKIYGEPMEFTQQDIKDLYTQQQGKCYYTGLEMKLRCEMTRDPMMLSCDRLDSSKGYVKGNVVLCCYGINMLKGQHTPETMYHCLADFYKGAMTIGKIKPGTDNNPSPAID